MAIPPLVLRIYADSTGVKKGVAQANAQVGGLRASVVKNAKLIGLGLAAGVAVGVVKAVNAAADLGEAQNKVNVIFGKSVAVVNRMGRGAATNIGLAKAEALSAAGAFGSMFDSAGLAEQASAKMSVTMTQLAGDMASFNNEDPTEMLERLRSGLAGEAEPLRRFGVFISEARVQQEAYRTGIAETGDELTDAQKVQARYNIILKDTNKQQGDFARTAGESLPNQLRILRAQFIDLAAKIGNVLVPIITTVVEWFNNVFTFIGQKLWPRLKEFGAWLKEKFTAFWNAIKEPIMAVLNPIRNVLEGIADGIVFLAEKAMPKFKGGWDKAEGPLGEFLGVLVDIRDRIAEVIEEWATFLREINASVSTPGEEFGTRFGGPQDLVPGRQHGGPVTAGGAYLVGEAGPELFVPRMSGAIIPNGAVGIPDKIVAYFDGEAVEGVVVRVLNKAGRR